MKLAIMQPYFLPYIGYFQLINLVDTFVIYDDVEYTKKGWINRNRFLQNKSDSLFTIPLKKSSDYLNINQRFIAESYNRKRLFSQLQNAYIKAPYYAEINSLLRNIIFCSEQNMFSYIFNSLNLVLDYLEIKTRIVISSTLNIDSQLKAQDKVLEICSVLNATLYINTIGGKSLYNRKAFNEKNIDLSLIKTDKIEYNQKSEQFEDNLSIIDVLMWNSKEQIHELLNGFKLI